MLSPTREELIQARTADGLTHTGIVIRPTATAPRPIAIIWIHGYNGKFYGAGQIQIGRRLASLGLTFISGNNRGHDFGYGPVSTSDGAPRLMGAAWERHDECQLDITAWLDVAAALGFRRHVLLAHSFAALKAVYSLSRQPDSRVVGLVLASPAIRHYRFYAHAVALDAARALVAQGRGDELLPTGLIPTRTYSAASYLHNAGTIGHFRFDTSDTPLADLRVPLLAFYGTQEAAIGTADDLDLIRRQAVAAPSVTTHMLDGANHAYAEREQVVAELVAAWVADLP